MLFLDEPTSGLDSHTSVEVMRFVQSIAVTGRTVIATIHQPSKEIFDMFRKLLLLCSGKVIYLGDTADVTGFFDPMVRSTKAKQKKVCACCPKAAASELQCRNVSLLLLLLLLLDVAGIPLRS